MKVFLSHSSKDKGYVEAVADYLRPGTYELDSLTFDSGLINAEAIIESLKRCDLFCLFLSANSIESGYVNFETVVSIDMYAKGLVRRILIICLDDDSFERASDNVKLFNAIRKNVKPDSAARLIQGALVTASKENINSSRPFVGRLQDLQILEDRLVDLSKNTVKAIYISGNIGSGRRTIARKFYENHFPKVGKIFPNVEVSEFSGLHELHRLLVYTLRPAIRSRKLQQIVVAFEQASIDEKRRQISELVNSLLTVNEAAMFIDQGGILTDSGELNPEIDKVITLLNDRPHPPAIFISPRMIPSRRRRVQDDIAYLALQSMPRQDSKRLISSLLRSIDLAPSNDDVEQLVDVADGHPYNIYRMVEEIREKGVAIFLNTIDRFINWKHRQSSEYLYRVKLDELEVKILAVLNLLPELDFEAFDSVLSESAEDIAEALGRLIDNHIIYSSEDRFAVSPALRVAIERDGRIFLPDEERKRIIQSLAQSLSVRIEDGSAPVVLVDAAVLSSLESNADLTTIAAAFLLPSHCVQLAKRHYDRRNWTESIRYSEKALDGASRLSSNGFVAACRYLCLAGTRIGDDGIFREGIGKLESEAKDDWAKSNVNFLRGFNSRFDGRLPDAEQFFRSAYELSPGNVSAARELAAICLARDELDDAEIFAREAYTQAGSNPFVLDILVSVLIRKYGSNANSNMEISDLLDKLEKADEESGRSFYNTRKAELEHYWGDNREAQRLIEAAIRKTPTLFEPRRIYAEVLLKSGSITKLAEELSVLAGMVFSNNPNDRRANYRHYLKLKSSYLVEIGKYGEAKSQYMNKNGVFTESEIQDELKNIDIVEAYRRKG